MKNYLLQPVLVILLFALFSCDSGRQSSETTEYEPPNVVLILVDDLGYGDLSFYGQEVLSTPQIDQMAAGGMHFTNMYTGSTVCAPSRASLLTGRHTGHSSVRGNHPEQLVGDDEMTIAKVFKNAGYTTGAVGKWGIGHPPPSDDPQKKGFDYFYGYINMWHAHNFYPEFLYENGEKVPLKNKTALKDGKNPWADKPEGTGMAEIKEEYVHDLFDEKALDFIEQNQENKFFLFLAYNVPHANNEAGSFSGDGMEVHDYYEFAEKDWPQPEKGFAAMIRNIDNSVGMILENLEDFGIDENTLVLFCSDNGPHQEGHHEMEFFNSNREFRGMKRDLYEGGVKTPFIAYWPGTIPEETKSDQLFAFWDFLPTFADLVDSEVPVNTDGISFLPTLLGEKQIKEHDYLYWEFFGQGGKQAIIKDGWKAVRLNVSQPGETMIELYNLKEDPQETTDVSAQHPELVEEFEALFHSAREEFEITPLTVREE